MPAKTDESGNVCVALLRGVNVGGTTRKIRALMQQMAASRSARPAGL